MRGIGPLEAGDRNRLVTVQYRTDADSDSEYPVNDWDVTREKQIWMSKMDVRGQEKLMALQVQATYDTRWVMGYRDDMDPEQVNVQANRRIVWKGRVHDIVSASIVGRYEGIEIVTRANPVGETVQ